MKKSIKGKGLVTAKYPDAVCISSDAPLGNGTVRVYAVYARPVDSRAIGHGMSAVEAWSRAARLCEDS